MKMKKAMTDQSMLWGSPVSFWDLWGLRLMFAGGLLGILALAASLASSFVLYRVADRVQVESDQRIAEAQADAAKANEHAKALEKAVAEANSRGEEAKANAERANLEQERIRQQLAWRRLTREQHDSIAAAVRRFSLNAPLNVEVPLGDVEAAVFAADLVRTFRDGGLPVDDPVANNWMTPPFGIIVRHPGAHPHGLAVAIASAGIQTVAEVNSSALTLVVGSKPMAF